MGTIDSGDGTTGPEPDEETQGSPVLEAVLENARNRRHLGERLDETDDRLDTDFLGDIVRHGPVLEALLEGPMDRREIEDRLDVSRATSHRFVHWLDDQDFVEKVDGRLRLTGQGEAVAEEVLRFEANVRGAERLSPLLEAVCEDHQEFVIEPFTEATVTVANPDDPFSPVRRFVGLLEESSTLRGFNTTHMVPLGFEAFHRQVFDETDTELIYLPSAVETLFSEYPQQAQAAVEQDHFAVRTRDDLPYGLAVLDERVGIAGYDEVTGLMRVFVDTDATIAREWAEQVYASVRSDSDPLDGRFGAGD